MAKIPEKVIETVMETASIIDVVSRYTKIEKRGERYFACCPFHKEKTPSFSGGICFTVSAAERAER